MSGGHDGHDGEASPRRFLIAVAVTEYQNSAWNSPGLEAGRQQIIELFTGLLGYELVDAVGLNPTKDQLRAAIRAFCRAPERRPDDLLAVYVGCHGALLEDDDHVLITADTEADDLGFTALRTAELATLMMSGTSICRFLLMLDASYAEQGGYRLAASATQRMPQDRERDAWSGLVVLSSSGAHQVSHPGVLPGLLADAIGSPSMAGLDPHLVI